MKKNHLITKTIWQCFVVGLEIFGVSSLLVWISSTMRPISDNFDMVERFILFLAGYEIVVYVVLSFINDARQDALLALKTGYEYGLLYCETGAEEIHAELTQVIEKQLDNQMFNHPDIQEKYEILRKCLEIHDDLTIRRLLQNISHQYEMCSLKWRFTFLLRIFK
jgi:hypothetical protein